MLGRRGLHLQVEEPALRRGHHVQVPAHLGRVELHPHGHVEAEPPAQLARHVPLQRAAEVVGRVAQAVAPAVLALGEPELHQHLGRLRRLRGLDVARGLGGREAAVPQDGAPEEEAEGVVA